MYLKLIEQNNIDKLINDINSCSRKNIIVIKYYDNIYVIVNLKNYSILFLVKYKINNSSDIEDIYNNIRQYLKKNIDNNFIDLKWDYYFKCNHCTMNNLLLINYNTSINNKKNICSHCKKTSNNSNKLIEFPNSNYYHIDCINNYPKCIYEDSKELLFQCEYCSKYILLKSNDIRYRPNLNCKNYYWNEIINNSIIHDYNILNCQNSNYLIINLRNKL